MTTFLALYRGNTIREAQLVGVSADTSLVSYVASQLLKETTDNDETGDVVAVALRQGRQTALQLIIDDLPGKDTKGKAK